MTYEEYRILIKAKFDEIRDKAFFDCDCVKTRAGVIDPSWVAAKSNELSHTINLLLGQIGDYTRELCNKIQEEVNEQKKKAVEELKKRLDEEQE